MSPNSLTNHHEKRVKARNIIKARTMVPHECQTLCIKKLYSHKNLTKIYQKKNSAIIFVPTVEQNIWICNEKKTCETLTFKILKATLFKLLDEKGMFETDNWVKQRYSKSLLQRFTTVTTIHKDFLQFCMPFFLAIEYIFASVNEHGLSFLWRKQKSSTK